MKDIFRYDDPSWRAVVIGTTLEILALVLFLAFLVFGFWAVGA